MQTRLTNGDTAEAIVVVDIDGQPAGINAQNVVQSAAPFAGDTVLMTDNNSDGTLVLRPNTSLFASDIFTVAVGNAANNDSVVIGNQTYTFKTVVTLPYQVLVGATNLLSATNLDAAINDSGTPGVGYGVGTAVHPDVNSTDNGDGTLTITANVAGTAGNSIQSVEDGTDLSFASATLLGGTDATGTIATLTVTLPTDGNSRIGQVRRVSSTQIVTALTVDGATTIHNNPTTLAANATKQFMKVAANEWFAF